MQGLLTDDQNEINAGEYCKIPIHSDEYVFPYYKCIPESMNNYFLVADYKSSFILVNRPPNPPQHYSDYTVHVNHPPKYPEHYPNYAV